MLYPADRVIGIDVIRLLNTPFERDFPDIVLARAKKKADKVAHLREKVRIFSLTKMVCIMVLLRSCLTSLHVLDEHGPNL